MLLSALIFGLLGSFHCVGMCGPIAFLLPIDRKNKTKRVLQLLSYHSGRLLTYAVLGFIFGLVGKSLNLFGFQQQLSILIGVLMIVVIVMPTNIFNKYNFSKPIYRAVSKVRNAMGKALKKKTLGTFFTIGYLNGLLPCGLVYMAIFGALASGNAWNGSLYMLVFGLGTVPLMTTAIYVGNFITGTLKKRILKAIPVFVFIIALLFILRGLGLGIKYISPSEMITVEEVSADNSCH
ncbi:sulfite exporter TauE/SafE family protein [Bizionia gelidisalsuginis]|uniref:Sulfite exporter TauE/SafE family protein n=1 Tax=Bizionia gelidisalsuginis TaxID=291188 RepID=A0ABY3MD23_9FLAO|nr:sulfite exporter TauE/SafE family protein [Bizionia gelidisalsuginis]TYC16261.1 sulfite exporter TauE/SafE family protein [Bizionia gelidisalsuginis]